MHPLPRGLSAPFPPSPPLRTAPVPGARGPRGGASPSPSPSHCCPRSSAGPARPALDWTRDTGRPGARLVATHAKAREDWHPDGTPLSDSADKEAVLRQTGGIGFGRGVRGARKSSRGMLEQAPGDEGAAAPGGSVPAGPREGEGNGEWMEYEDDGPVLVDGVEIASSLLDLLGMEVALADTGASIGHVEEVIEMPGGAADIIRVVEGAMRGFAEGEEDVEEGGGEGEDDRASYLIPLAPDIISGLQHLDVVGSEDGPEWAASRLLITPPAGLLEVGRSMKQSETEYLREEIRRFWASSPGSEAEAGRSMPTRQELEGAGRKDLVRQIMRAGGFPSVALEIGLRAKRRPVGFWDQLSNLDKELELFVAASWTQHDEPGTGEVYYYNSSSGEMSWTRPEWPEDYEGIGYVWEYSSSRGDGEWGGVIPGLPPSPPDLSNHARSMPTRATISAAGRYDLHHAIVLHGGYKRVAEILERTPPRRRPPELDDPEALREELIELSEELREEEAFRQALEALEAERAALADTAIDRYVDQSAVDRYLREEDEAAAAAEATATAAEAEGGGEDGSSIDRYPEELRSKLLALEAAAAEGRDEPPPPPAPRRGRRGTRRGNLEVMPTKEDIRLSGRGDLLYAINLQGGYSVLAPQMGMAVAKVPRGHWDDLATVCRAVGKFIEEQAEAGVQEGDRLPTQVEFNRAGRGDLRGAVQKQGHDAVARALGVKVNRKGRGGAEHPPPLPPARGKGRWRARNRRRRG